MMDLDTHGYTISKHIDGAFVGKASFSPAKDMKFDDEKTQAAIVLQDFSLALAEIAKVCTYGANKYKRHSWSTVSNKSERYEDAMIRHLLAYNNNEEFDPESKLSHRAHFAWGALATLQMYLESKNKQYGDNNMPTGIDYPLVVNSPYPIPNSTGDYIDPNPSRNINLGSTNA